MEKQAYILPDRVPIRLKKKNEQFYHLTLKCLLYKQQGAGTISGKYF